MTLFYQAVVSHNLALAISLVTLAGLSSCQNAEELEEDQPRPLLSALTPSQISAPTWRAELQRLTIALKQTPVSQDVASRQRLITLERAASEHPKLASHFNLQRAKLLFDRGLIERGIEISKPLWNADHLIAVESRLLVAANTQSCLLMEEALDPSVFEPTHEQYLMLRWRQDSHCEHSRARLKSERTLAKAYPKRFTRHRLQELFRGLSPTKALALTLQWEKRRAPHQAIHLLEGVLGAQKLDSDDEWRLSFERERIQIERIREGYKKSIKRIKSLARAKKQKGREAQLLLAKALSKAGDARRAQRVYRGLIKEWEHSPEAKLARFNLAFSLYEQKKYRQAKAIFVELCRHRGEVTSLDRFPQRAPPKDISNSAEWYFAWTLYLTSPRQAAPFLEALIGRGAPLSTQGRRAAYWAAKAYASHQPERAAELRTALLNSDYRDWYSLLLRAEDPSLATDHKPWPRMPPLPPAQYQTYAQSHEASSKSHPSLDPQKRQLPAELSALERKIEFLSMRRQLSALLGQNSIIDQIDRELASLVRRDLETREGFSPWAVEVEQYKELHRWLLSRSPSKLREIPVASDHLWWRSVFPLAFEVETHRASQETEVSQELLLSFIYKESAFAPRAISHAYAMGLMQLLEKTAKALHPDQAPPNLLQANQNIQLGAEYIAALSARYHDQIPLVAAAYNAGPQNLNRWLKRVANDRSERKLDLFVELIPFKEAREYVKRLTAIHCTYQYLYGQQSINTCANLLPLTLNVTIEPGVNF